MLNMFSIIFKTQNFYKKIMPSKKRKQSQEQQNEPSSKKPKTTTSTSIDTSKETSIGFDGVFGVVICVECDIDGNVCVFELLVWFSLLFVELFSLDSVP